MGSPDSGNVHGHERQLHLLAAPGLHGFGRERDWPNHGDGAAAGRHTEARGRIGVAALQGRLCCACCASNDALGCHK